MQSDKTLSNLECLKQHNFAKTLKYFINIDFIFTFLVEEEELRVLMMEVWEEEGGYWEEQEVGMEPRQEEEQEHLGLLLL